MTLVTEFRPVSHEFYPEEFHGAAFVGAKTADALWFYRFDSTFIEVRDIFTCQDRVFASLSTADIKQRFRDLLRGNEIRIVNVQDAYVGEFHALVFVVREVQEDRDHVFIWNLLTLHLQLLVSAPRLLTAATVTAQQAITRNNNDDATSPSIDMDEEEEEHEEEEDSQSRVRLQGNRRQLLVLGHRNGWVTIYKFTISLTGQVSCAKEPEHEISLNNGSITSFATLSNKNAGSIPVIVAGTSEAKVFVIKYDGAQESKKLQVLMALEDLKSKNLPITSITLEHTNDEMLDLLAVGQGYAPGMKECGECPTISIYYLRPQKSDYRLLGYVQPPMLEGEVATGGKTLAATVSEDANGLRIHCAFSIQVGQAPLRSNLTTVQINNKDVQNLDVVEMTANEGGTLLDISSQTNSYELAVLYLGKIVNYVHAADIEWNRKESEWADGVDEQETMHRDLAPMYGLFFEEKAKFNYTDSELAEIEQRRRQMGGTLFYDRLLQFVELEVGALYPPRNHAQQRNLWTNIYFNGNLDTDNRNCLAYYLLKNQHGYANERFLKEYMIPPRFVDLMNGFWALDHFEFKSAILYLSRPGLTVDWLEEVIETIYEHGSPHLALQFMVAANLDLKSSRFVELKMKALLGSDFAEAFYFQRSSTLSVRAENNSVTEDGDAKMSSVPAGKKEHLFTLLLDHCFLDKPNRKAIRTLSLLTMNDAEEGAFIQYCDQHSGLTREVGQEFLIMYYVNHSRYLEAIRLHRKLLAVELENEDAEKFHREAIERRNSRQFGEGAKQSSGSKNDWTKGQKRQLLIDNLMMVLPAAQKVVLELEEEQTTSSSAQEKREKTVGGGSSIKGVVETLMKEVDGPLTSLKGVDLNSVTRSLNRHVPGGDMEGTDDQEAESVRSGRLKSNDSSLGKDNAHTKSEDGAIGSESNTPKVFEADIMDVDSDDDL
ncbi:nuclear pore complex assembly-domain-containing protein [Dissophora ornata]|nr:nuclear pore complex assembly-domain-containing protein [Dissophora ornata]